MFRSLYDGVEAETQTESRKPIEEVTRQLQAVMLPILRRVMKGKDVLALQYLLSAYGYKLPKYGADGEFGEETEQALVAYQKHNGLEADGKCGAMTYTKLLR